MDGSNPRKAADWMQFHRAHRPYTPIDGINPHRNSPAAVRAAAEQREALQRLEAEKAKVNA